ncbi:MAG: type II toxin-antitoxin system RelE/ParE family toxin [Bryobacteraceae bacterium]|jgi:mRNA-degrading endonuclease RelE of RelBE toxin-antitoxin system
MRWLAELSGEAQKQLARLSPDVRQRIVRAIDEFEEKDDFRRSNIKALEGPAWKGRLGKKVGPYRIIFTKYPSHGVVEISAILLRSKSTYR